jgi:hypothetical protein
MSINVYWACIEPEWQLAEPPESVAASFYKKGLHDPESPSTCFNYCPSFNANLKNVFAVKSIYDYSFKIIDEKSIGSDTYDQNFFDQHVGIRSLEKKIFSFRQRYVFFTDAPDLDVTFYEHPCFEDNNITKRCMIVPGQYNIAKWFRNSEFSFFLKKEFDEFKVEKNEVLYYLRFHTKETIVFKQFRFNNNLRDFQLDGFALNGGIAKLRYLENYYKSFKNKKLILKEIKENLL